MKSWVREFALGLLLTTAMAPPVALAATGAVQVLLDKANYWRLKDRPDLAVAALQQLLSINPNEPDALYQYGMIDVQQGKIDDARGYLGRLRNAAPSSPHVADLENAIRAGQVSPNQLNEARRLAQSGQFAQAAREYEQTFKGPPPPTFGIEYYQTLAGTQQGWEQARRGLEGLVQNSPNDSKAKLALAEVLTYHAETRGQGIRMLDQLSGDPVVGQQAVRSWKQALTWLGGGPQDRQFYAQYLAKYPQDAEIRQHVATAEKGGAPGPARTGPARTGPVSGGRPRSEGPPGPPANPARTRADNLRAEGKSLETRGDTVAAQAKYQEAIAVDPADAWARLDLARLLARRGDATQAFQIVDPAAAGNTAEANYAAAIFYNEQNHPREALALLDRIPPGSRSSDMAAFHDQILITSVTDRAKQLAAAGNTAAARNVLMALYQQPPQTAAKARSIADALADIGDAQDALQIARPPATGGDPKATLDYAGLLFRAGRDAEAVAYLAQAERSRRITSGDRQELEHTKIDIAVKRADQLRTAGDNAGAYDQISPLLTAYPNNATLLTAAGRIYAAAGQNEIAMRFFDAAYRQAPGDINVIRGVVGGSIVAGDLTRAQAYLTAGMRLYPNNPRLYYLAAQIARSNGDNGAAVYDLNLARRFDRGDAGDVEPVPANAPASAPGMPVGMPPNPFRQSEADQARPPVMLAQAGNPVSATDASPMPPAPLAETAVSADSADLVVPPRVSERPPRRSAPAVGSTEPAAIPPTQLAMLPGDDTPDTFWARDAAGPARAASTTQIAQMQPLPPPPIQGYQPVAAPPPAGAEPLQPLPPPPIAGYQPPLTSSPTLTPRNSLELDIERSMAAIAAESGPILQGGFAFRERSGEDGLSHLTEIGAPVEGIFSPFYTGTMRLQAVPDFIDAGTPAVTALNRFGRDPLLQAPAGSGVIANLPSPGSQTAAGVSFNLGYAYQMFAGEIGTTPLGFPVDNIVGRIALQWPGPATLSTAYPTIPPPITGAVSRPFQVKVEGIRQPVTDSLLSYAGTKDPVSGDTWGGVIKSGGDVLLSYDDGFFGMYGGGGASSLDGKATASNSEIEGLVGAYIRPYRTNDTALKVGLNLAYMGYDKNLQYFTFGQGGYFSPQNYVNFSVPVEYSGRNGRWSWLAGAALGLENFHANSSPYFPTDPAAQSTLLASGNPAIYAAQNVTGPSFFINGQIEYQLDNGFSVGGIASVDNAQNYTEGIAKVYLRKSFGVTPPVATFPNPFARSL